MSSEQAGVSAKAASQYGALSSKYMGEGIAGLSDRSGLISGQMAAGGELPGTAGAYDAQRAGLIDQGARSQLGGIQQGLGAQKGLGGSEVAGISGADWGAKLAQYLGKSRLSQGAAGLEQMGNLMGMQLGQAGQTGSASMSAAGRQLQGIGMLPNYNPTYAGIVGAANMGGSIFGGLNQAGAFGGGAGWTGTPLPMGTSYTGVG